MKKHYLLIIFIVIQTVLYIIVGNYKANLHIDEAYSFGLTHYDTISIQDNTDFFDNWHTGKYYENYLTINENEIWNLNPVYENQKNDVHPPLYYLLLRIAMSFSIGKFTMWTGIGLNIIIYIFITICMYQILKKLLKNEQNYIIKASVLSFMSSITLASISNVIYIRMYSLLTLIILLTIFLHIKLLENTHINYKLLLCIGITALLGSLTHYYYIIFLAVLYLIFAIKYIKNKNLKLLKDYTITIIISAIASLLIFPYSLNHIFCGYRGEGVISNLKTVSKFIPNICMQLYNLNYYAFNGILLILVIAIILLLIYNKIHNKKSIAIDSDKKEILKIIAIPSTIFFIFSAISSPWMVLRYFVPVCGLIFVLVIYILYKLLQTVFTEKNTNIIIILIFCVMLLSPFVLKLTPELMYLEQKDVIEKLGNELNVPTIYFLSSENNSILSSIYLFAQIDESYITKTDECSSENINNILQDKNLSNGIVVFIGTNQNSDYILDIIEETTGLENIKYIAEFNSSNIYYIN